jgi:hypothetical protein
LIRNNYYIEKKGGFMIDGKKQMCIFAVKKGAEEGGLCPSNSIYLRDNVIRKKRNKIKIY